MTSSKDGNDCLSLIFLAWERARNLGDFRRAAEAQEELERRGVLVRLVTAKKRHRKEPRRDPQETT